MKVKLLVQIGIVFGICLVGEGIAAVLPFAFPASVLSMLLLFVCCCAVCSRWSISGKREISC